MLSIPAQTQIYGFAAVDDGTVPSILFAAETVAVGPDEPSGPTAGGVVVWLKDLGGDTYELWIEDGS